MKVHSSRVCTLQLHAATVLIVLTNLFKHYAGGVQITALRVPEEVRNGSDSGAILDCEYTLRPNELGPESGLVVKWFWNNSPAPVYQWIPGQRPQDLGVLRGRLKLDYKASLHPFTMHRAMYITNPTTELSGEYRCSVSTFTDEDFMVKKMVVYAPERKVDLGHSKHDLHNVNITCRALGLYPEPKMTIHKGTDLKTLEEMEGVAVRTLSKEESYDVMASVLLSDSELRGSMVVNCEVWIPTTSYRRQNTLHYYHVCYSEEMEGVAVRTLPREESYDVMASVLLSDSELRGSLVVNCEVWIPTTSYRRQKTLHYYHVCYSEEMEGVAVRTLSREESYDVMASVLLSDSELRGSLVVNCEVWIPTTSYRRQKTLHYYHVCYSEEMEGVAVRTLPREESYDVMASVLLSDSELRGSMVVNCEVWIPTTSYRRQKTLHYYHVCYSEEMEGVAVRTLPREESYDVMASVLLSDSELRGSLVVNCEVWIPTTSYRRQKTLHYYPGRALPWIGEEDSGGSRLSSREQWWFLFSTLMLLTLLTPLC